MCVDYTIVHGNTDDGQYSLFEIELQFEKIFFESWGRFYFGKTVWKHKCKCRMDQRPFSRNNVCTLMEINETNAHRGPILQNVEEIPVHIGQRVAERQRYRERAPKRTAKCRQKLITFITSAITGTSLPLNIGYRHMMVERVFDIRFDSNRLQVKKMLNTGICALGSFCFSDFLKTLMPMHFEMQLFL